MRRGEGSAPADRGRAIVTARQDPPNRNGGRHCCRPPLSPRGGSSGLERRDVRAGRFRTSADERNRGFRHPRRSGSIPGLRPFRLPAGSPSGPGPWRFAADEQSVRRLNLSLPLASAEAMAPHSAKSLAEASGSSDERRTEIPHPPLTPQDRSPVRVRQFVQDRGPFRPARSPCWPKPFGTSWALTKPAVRIRFGKAVASASRRLRQPPRLRVIASSPGGQEACFARAVAGKAFVRFRSIVSATTRKLS